MPINIKICGLSTEDSLNAALEAGADMIGLVHFEKSPRHVGLQQGRALADLARGRAHIVALLVDPLDNVLEAICAAAAPDYLQLHGQESPQRVLEIQRRFGVRIIKAIGIGEKQDFDQVAAYTGLDYVLLDAKPSHLPGGNGVPFDWSLAQGFYPAMPWMLSGGLCADNVVEAIRQSGARAVDVSSGVENAPGVKDKDKISAFIKAVRSVSL